MPSLAGGDDILGGGCEKEGIGAAAGIRGENSEEIAGDATPVRDGLAGGCCANDVGMEDETGGGSRLGGC